MMGLDDGRVLFKGREQRLAPPAAADAAGEAEQQQQKKPPERGECAAARGAKKTERSTSLLPVCRSPSCAPPHF